MPFTKEELLALSRDPQLSTEERMEAFRMYREPPPKPTEGGFDTLSGVEKLKKGGSLVGRGVEFAGGLIPNPLVRLPAVAAGGTLAELSEGGDLGDVSKRVGGNLALETIFPGLGKMKGAARGASDLLKGGLAHAFPEAGLQVGLRLGGLRGDVDKAVGAFMRERQRHGWGGGVLPGTRRKVASRRKDLGQTLEQLETAAPGEAVLADVVEPASQQIRTFGKSSPHATARAAVGNQKTFLRKPATVKGYGNVGHPEIVNVRQLGDIKRTQQREASRLIESRLSGASPYDPTSVAEEMAANRAKLLKEAQEKLAPEIIPTNENLSDLLSIQSINKALRGGGGLVQDVGGIGVRGGLGAGVGRSLFGSSGSGIGGLLGMTLLNPKLSAGTGFGLGRGAELTPSMWRLLDALSREGEEE